jgi:CubicO group peptidase (beta-lactamase class C family)
MRVLAGLVGAMALMFAAPPPVRAETEDALIARRLAATRAAAPIEAVYQPAKIVRGAPRASPLPRAHAGLDPAAIDAAARYVEGFGRGALLVWRDGALVGERYFGGADAETRFDSLSMHKTLVALLIGRAIADGAIASVDEPAATYLEEWRGDGRSAITIRQLLTMSAGIERQRLAPEPPYNLETRMLFGDDVWAHALARGVAAAPGTVFHYNNVETQLLGIVLERATGVPYPDYLSKTLWSRIGSQEAILWGDAKGRARTYCCMLARPEDWVRVGRLFLDDGKSGRRRILPRAWMAAARAPSPLNPGYGYQLWRGAPAEAMSTAGAGSRTTRAEPYLVEDLVMLFGFGGQRTYISKRCNLVIVRNGAQTQEWDDSVLPNTIIRGLPGGGC